MTKERMPDYARTCPSCRGKNWMRSRTYARITTCENGYTQSRMVRTDAFNFMCYDCGYESSE